MPTSHMEILMRTSDVAVAIAVATIVSLAGVGCSAGRRGSAAEEMQTPCLEQLCRYTLEVTHVSTMRLYGEVRQLVGGLRVKVRVYGL